MINCRKSYKFLGPTEQKRSISTSWAPIGLKIEPKYAPKF